MVPLHQDKKIKERLQRLDQGETATPGSPKDKKISQIRKLFNGCLVQRETGAFR